MASILRQPAALTLWTWIELQDSDRIAVLLARSVLYEAAGLTAVATWNGTEFERMEAGFRSTLRTHPDPDVEERARATALAKGVSIIERASVIGGKGPRRQDRETDPAAPAVAGEGG